MRKEIIGDATLYYGDCLDIMPGLAHIGHIITDPPYMLSLSNDCEQKLNPWGNIVNGAIFMGAWLGAAKATLGGFGSMWSFINWQSLPTLTKAAFDVGAQIRSVLVWDKKYPGPGMVGLRPTHELICFMPVGGYKIADRTVPDIWQFPWAMHKPTGHSAEKPVALLSRLIEVSTSQGELILDPFLGSGSTGVAALKMGRKFVGIELDEHWFDVACCRIEDAWRESSLMRVATPQKQTEQLSLVVGDAQ